MSVLNILLVEDDDVDVMTVQRALDQSGVTYSLEVSRRGSDALEGLQQTSETRRPPPDLVLLDLNLPMLSGLEFLEQLRKAGDLSSIPVVVLTTSAHDDDVARALDLGAAGYFVKPVGFDEFVSMLATVCHYWSLSLRGTASPGMSKGSP